MDLKSFSDKGKACATLIANKTKKILYVFL